MSAALSRDLLEARIARERDALAETLGEIRARAQAEIDVGRRVRERPAAWLAGACLAGLLLGLRR